MSGPFDADDLCWLSTVARHLALIPEHALYQVRANITYAEYDPDCPEDSQIVRGEWIPAGDGVYEFYPKGE